MASEAGYVFGFIVWAKMGKVCMEEAGFLPFPTEKCSSALLCYKESKRSVRRNCHLQIFFWRRYIW